jgi:hypothetical protein
MKKLFTILIATFVAQTSFSQLADFENLTFPSGVNYWKGIPGSAGDSVFSTGSPTNNISLINKNDSSSGINFWSGWAYSKGKDSLSTSYDTSDCNAFPAIGYNNSNNYAVAYQSWDDYYNRIRLNLTKTAPNYYYLTGFYITNSTLAYRSMQNGDGFAKKFGGITGNDADYFKVRFTGWKQGLPLNDTFDFYLADFRDANNANDYIVKDWTLVSLPTTFYLTDSLTYVLESSDIGGFGMNTPAYFCVDNFVIDKLGSVNDVSQNTTIKIYPNPINNEFQISNTSTEAMKFSIMNLNGQTIYTNELIGNNSMKINSEKWSKGVYVIKIQQGQHQFYQKIIK